MYKLIGTCPCPRDQYIHTCVAYFDFLTEAQLRRIEWEADGVSNIHIIKENVHSSETIQNIMGSKW